MRVRVPPSAPGFMDVLEALLENVATQAKPNLLLNQQVWLDVEVELYAGHVAVFPGDSCHNGGLQPFWVQENCIWEIFKVARIELTTFFVSVANDAGCAVVALRVYHCRGYTGLFAFVMTSFKTFSLTRASSPISHGDYPFLVLPGDTIIVE